MLSDSCGQLAPRSLRRAITRASQQAMRTASSPSDVSELILTELAGHLSLARLALGLLAERHNSCPSVQATLQHAQAVS